MRKTVTIPPKGSGRIRKGLGGRWGFEKLIAGDGNSYAVVQAGNAIPSGSVKYWSTRLMASFTTRKQPDGTVRIYRTA
jgi:hypothetical protein